jgi:signal peptidase II
MKTIHLYGLALAVLVVITDQLSKLAILHNVHDSVALLPIFNLTLVWNHGVSFGMFNHGGMIPPVLFMAISLIIACGFGVWMFKTDSRLVVPALGLVIGGAIGNVIDRAHLGAVVDFLDFHIGDWHYPAFNVADSAVVIGIALVLVDSLFFSANKRRGP